MNAERVWRPGAVIGSRTLRPPRAAQLHVLVSFWKPREVWSTWVLMLHQRALGCVTGKKEKIGSAKTAGGWMNSGISFVFSGCALQC